MSRLAIFLSAAALLTALEPSGAWAAATCTSGGVSMSLGTYIGDTSAPVDSIGALTVTCTRSGGNATFPVTLGIGASATSGTISNRTMRLSTGTDQLAYNLYSDGGRVSVWGDTVGLDTVTQNITVPNKGSASITFTLYGRMNGLQSVSPGIYGDSLIATITY